MTSKIELKNEKRKHLCGFNFRSL